MNSTDLNNYSTQPVYYLKWNGFKRHYDRVSIAEDMIACTDKFCDITYRQNYTKQSITAGRLHNLLDSNRTLRIDGITKLGLIVHSTHLEICELRA